MKIDGTMMHRNGRFFSVMLPTPGGPGTVLHLVCATNGIDAYVIINTAAESAKDAREAVDALAAVLDERCLT